MKKILQKKIKKLKKVIIQKKVKKVKNYKKTKRKNYLEIMIQILFKKLDTNQQQLHIIIQDNMMKQSIKLKKVKIINKIFNCK